MPITIDWANEERTIILETFGPQWTWNEFMNASVVKSMMMEAVGHRVDVIADARNTTLPPGAVQSIPYVVENAACYSHPNGGAYIVVGGSPLIEAFARIYARTYLENGRRLLFAETIDEALALLTGQMVA
ncbi:MAG: hypothetical protein Kow00124_16720 [Anaerolineae bacterium]